MNNMNSKKSSSKPKTTPKSHKPENKAKKTDGDDEESKGFVEV
jgi:hypothetical protein